MIAECGIFTLILSLLFSILLVFIPTIGIYKQKSQLQNSVDYYVLGQFIFLTLSYLALTLCFLRDDFTVIYVLNNSSISLPWFYKLCAVWGGHEGSMLLWVIILSFWTLLVSLFSKSIDSIMRSRILIVLGAINAGLILFILSTSNPFLRQFQMIVTKGRDLNPLLQDPGFLFHPPMLYMGYVGFSVAFSFAIAALWAGKVDSAWAKWTRPWTLASWCFLTAGITLGSWWAYRELGWGGWWFWDPVENASFMPWLAGTALIHSLAINDKRQQFLGWTLLLAIIAFSLSLLGTFLVRSGVLTSVHAFAVDPKRGLYILLFLCFVIGGSLLLFAIKAPNLITRKKIYPLSRENGLLLNTILLMVILASILLGTIYPLLIDALGLGKLSVGAPYFNTVFVPLVVPLFIAMGFGIHLHWNENTYKEVWLRLKYPIIGILIVSITAFVSIKFEVALGLSLAFWIITTTMQALILRMRQKKERGIGQGFIGMIIAHIGVAIAIIGIAVSSGFGLKKDVRLEPSDTVNLAGYKITFLQENNISGANYHGVRAAFKISKNNLEHTIYPEKRIYDVGNMAMTESAIDVNPFRDLYIALGEPLDETAWSVRIHYKPLVRCIWGGGFLVFMGGVFALTDRRYYKRKKAFQCKKVLA